MEKLAVPVVALAFCAWAVSLGGIASLQESCSDTELVAPHMTTGGLPSGILIKELSNLAQSLGAGWQLPSLKAVAEGGSWFIQSASMAGVRGFSATVLQCDEVYRYYWAIVSFQFAIVMAAFYFIIAGALNKSRAALIGLFVVATLLYMQSADSFLTAETVEWYKHGQYEHRARTMTAGCIMTGVANCLVIFVLGYVEGPSC